MSGQLKSKPIVLGPLPAKKNHMVSFWFTNEEPEHVEQIMRAYEQKLGVNKSRPANSRAPLCFVGCVKRRLIEITQRHALLSAVKKQKTNQKNQKQIKNHDVHYYMYEQDAEDTTVATLDEIYIHKRDKLPIGSLMPLHEKQLILTEWDEEGLPANVTKLTKEQVAKSSSESDEEEGPTTFLYCLPEFDRAGSKYFSTTEEQKVGYADTLNRCVANTLPYKSHTSCCADAEKLSSAGRSDSPRFTSFEFQFESNEEAETDDQDLDLDDDDSEDGDESALDAQELYVSFECSYTVSGGFDNFEFDYAMNQNFSSALGDDEDDEFGEEDEEEEEEDHHVKTKSTFYWYTTKSANNSSSSGSSSSSSSSKEDEEDDDDYTDDDSSDEEHTAPLPSNNKAPTKYYELDIDFDSEDEEDYFDSDESESDEETDSDQEFDTSEEEEEEDDDEDDDNNEEEEAEEEQQQQTEVAPPHHPPVLELHLSPLTDHPDTSFQQVASPTHKTDILAKQKASESVKPKTIVS